MSKKKKIVLEQAIISENDGVLSITGNTKTETLTFKLDEELKQFIGEDNLSFKLAKKRNSKGINRKPTYKFECSECGKIVKSSDENINLQCLDCNVKLEILNK